MINEALLADVNMEIYGKNPQQLTNRRQSIL